MRRHSKHGARVSVAPPPSLTAAWASRFTQPPTPVPPVPQHSRGHGGEWRLSWRTRAGGGLEWGNSRIALAISRAVAWPPAWPRAMHRGERPRYPAHHPLRPLARRVQAG